MLINRIANPPPGMLRRWSPVRDILAPHYVGVVTDLMDIERPFVFLPGIGVYGRSLADVALDLTDETGRAHLAAWVDLQYRGKPWPFSVAETQVLFLATNFRAMTPAEIDLLARLTLRAMGREA